MYKKGHNSGKNRRKIIIIELGLDIHKIHIHTTPSFNPTFCSHVSIQKPIRDWRTDARTIPVTIVSSTKHRGTIMG